MNIEKDFRNDVLHRRELVCTFDADSNPGLAASSKEIATLCKVDEETIIVRRVRNKFGSNTFFVEAYVYDSAESKSEIEAKKKEKKGVKS